ISSGTTASAPVQMAQGGVYTCTFTAKSQRECPPSDHTLPSSPSVKVAGIQTVTATANGASGQVSFCDLVPVDIDAQVQQINCGNLTYEWTFSDGDTAATKSTSHLFRGGPPYSETVNVTCSQNGCTDSRL